MAEIESKIQNHLINQLPFVLYSKPNVEGVIAMFQKDDSLFSVNDFSEKGFVFASFDGTKTYLIPEKESEIMHFSLNSKESLPSKTQFRAGDDVAKREFESLVSKGILAISNNQFKKVVLSRKEHVNIEDFNMFETFEKLVQLYPSAFVYCFYHPEIGNWIGATPEQLLKVNGGKFETISLAGTQKDTGSSDILWGEKEKEEQQFVTDYLVSRLESVASDVKFTEPYSIKAGSIWHIKTDVSGDLNFDSSLKEVVQLLHPTPAVCGLPKEIAKEFIIENEPYDRGFYTGFLGELNCNFTNKKASSDLFVNLRCMEVKNSQAHLYMGCGITKDSIPDKEWEESVNKSMTMKKVL
ncbi:chorismate-binding protein [Flavobacterium weaverense]|uniref:isochorismate synthase n=1 Tax=Flavobacterium weaverense TaxID=271156 RepID=A0A3M0A1R4_9FLAO|nr:chorismate-binding protein [Flavobacterium weaverense]RMA78364.1 isochorismate synthase [Flavobacterium weaverense]